MPHRLKSEALRALRSSGALAVVRWFQRRRTLVLAYHGVLTRDRAESTYLDYNFLHADRFAAQMAYLRERYHPISLTEFVEAQQQGRALPERSVLVTFDDGFANNHAVAFPILRAHRIPACVFLTTGMIGRADAQLWTERVSRSVYLSPKTTVELELKDRRVRIGLSDASARERVSRSLLSSLKREPASQREHAVAAIELAFGRPALGAADAERYKFLSWDEVRTMAAGGIEFGSHTVSHPIVSTLDDDSLRWELVESKREIEQQLDRPCLAFAYPNGGRGDFGPREQAAVRDAGYRCAFALLGGLTDNSSDVFAAERVNVGRDYDDVMFEAASAGVLGLLQKARSGSSPGTAAPAPLLAELDDVH